jgi:hypothetical protein
MRLDATPRPAQSPPIVADHPGTPAPGRERAFDRLAALFADGEWPTERVLRRRAADRNPFMSANVALILERCGTLPEVLARQMAAARTRMTAHMDRHLVYHWPLEDGISRMSDAPFIGRLPFMQLSPDADCTSLVHLARHDTAHLDAVLDELVFYRALGPRFRLPAFQASLPGAAHSFLTWFPPRERCTDGKLETVDLGADCNILWYLAAHDRLGVPGAAQTLAFVTACVKEELILRQPFRVSPYYPSPAVQLFLLARTAVWGKVEPLRALTPELQRLIGGCPVRSTMDVLCRAAAAKLLGASGSYAIAVPDGHGAFYAGPLLMWPLQRWAALEPLAAAPRTHWAFRGEALEWALYCWLTAAS